MSAQREFERKDETVWGEERGQWGREIAALPSPITQPCPGGVVVVAPSRNPGQ